MKEMKMKNMNMMLRENHLYFHLPMQISFKWKSSTEQYTGLKTIALYALEQMSWKYAIRLMGKWTAAW